MANALNSREKIDQFI